VNQEFERCLQSKKIVSFAGGSRLASKELSVATSDLSDAQAGYDFPNAMSLRGAADYEAQFSESGARAVTASAEKFIERATAILQVSE
jgi:hypothetical protein